MFHYNGDLCLPGCDLWLDARSPKPVGFVSHAHSDHIARHGHLLATPETLQLCQHRLGKRPGQALPYRVPMPFGDVQLTTFPAGHVLGSAMLLVETPKGSLLYTGDFRLKAARTCAPADVPQADILIMESTYGHPRYRFPDRKKVEADFLASVGTALAHGVTPIILVYSLGKAQEITRILTDAGVPVMVHDAIFKINQLYEELGVPLGNYVAWQPGQRNGHACLVPPTVPRRTLDRIRPRKTIQLSGWAMDHGATYRFGVDECFPFSDHADYDELFALLDRVNPRCVYCTHGPAKFVDRLKAAGWDARRLGTTIHQPMLF